MAMTITYCKTIVCVRARENLNKKNPLVVEFAHSKRVIFTRFFFFYILNCSRACTNSALLLFFIIIVDNKVGVKHLYHDAPRNVNGTSRGVGSSNRTVVLRRVPPTGAGRWWRRLYYLCRRGSGRADAAAAATVRVSATTAVQSARARVRVRCRRRPR